MKPVIFAISLFCFVIAIIAVPIVNQPEPKQYFADAYLKVTLRDIFVIPVANSTANIRMILPKTLEGLKVVVLKEIQLGPDNGLREAMYRLVYERHHFKPPFYSAEMGELLEEVITEW